MRLLLFVPALLIAACSGPPAVPIAPTPNVSATVNRAVEATLSARPTTAPTVAPTAAPTLVAVGQQGFLYATLRSGLPAETVYFAGSEAGFLRYVKAVRANDTVGIRNLMAALELDFAHTGYRVLVIDSARDTVDVAKVRFIDEYFDTVGWLDRSWIVSELPAGFVAPTPIPTPGPL